jgi:hypothetical protein
LISSVFSFLMTSQPLNTFPFQSSGLSSPKSLFFSYQFLVPVSLLFPSSQSYLNSCHFTNISYSCPLFIAHTLNRDSTLIKLPSVLTSLLKPKSAFISIGGCCHYTFF